MLRDFVEQSRPYRQPGFLSSHARLVRMFGFALIYCCLLARQAAPHAPDRRGSLYPTKGAISPAGSLCEPQRSRHCRLRDAEPTEQLPQPRALVPVTPTGKAPLPQPGRWACFLVTGEAASESGFPSCRGSHRTCPAPRPHSLSAPSCGEPSGPPRTPLS